jgi:hypothetical protein
MSTPYHSASGSGACGSAFEANHCGDGTWLGPATARQPPWLCYISRAVNKHSLFLARELSACMDCLHVIKTLPVETYGALRVWGEDKGLVGHQRAML